MIRFKKKKRSCWCKDYSLGLLIQFLPSRNRVRLSLENQSIMNLLTKHRFGFLRQLSSRAKNLTSFEALLPQYKFIVEMQKLVRCFCDSKFPPPPPISLT